MTEPSRPWRLRTRELDVAAGVLMGIVNVTPDSFSDGGLFLDAGKAIERGLEMADQGAAIIDVGGESTRPGADPVEAGEEMARVIPVVAGLARERVIVSVDTAKPEVAQAAVQAGAEIINDVTAGNAAGMAEVAASTGAGVVLMHMQGTPRTMQEDPRYDDVVSEVTAYLESRVRAFASSGVAVDAIAIDPGIGFGKTVAHNLELISGVGRLADLGRPVVLGTSRKRFLGSITGIQDPEGRDGATAVMTALGFGYGARVFRVHDVPGSRAALALSAAIVARQRWDEWSQG